MLASNIFISSSSLVRGLAVSQLDDFVLMLAMQLAQFQGSARSFGPVPTTTTKDQAKQNKQTEKAKAKATKDASKAQGVRKRPRVRMRPMPWPTETEHQVLDRFRHSAEWVNPSQAGRSWDSWTQSLINQPSETQPGSNLVVTAKAGFQF